MEDNKQNTPKDSSNGGKSRSNKNRRNKAKKQNDFGTLGSILDPDIIKGMYKLAYKPKKG